MMKPIQITEPKKEADKQLKDRMSKIRNKIIVMSGKGGVGKTSVSVNLACALAQAGRQTGLLDIDLHGPNIAKMLGAEGKGMRGSDDGIEPVRVMPNLKAASVAFAVPDADHPIIWRGPVKAKVIRQFLEEINWGDLDYLIIDSPPGTGDEPLSACQLIPGVSGAVIVTTPQDVAILDARKSVSFARQLDIPVIGIVENMSGFVCPHCGKEVDLFKRGGGEKAAHDMGVPFLGRIPFEPELVDLADRGIPFVSVDQADSASSRAFKEICRKIEEFVSIRKGDNHGECQ
jgi:ATP-binding protein involved in chromosome partitioning